MTEAAERVIPSRVRIGAWIQQGWDIFVQDPGTHVLIALLPAVVLYVGFPLFLVVGGPMAAGFALAGLRKFREGQVELKDFLDGFRHFLPAMLAFLLIFVFMVMGLIFLIVPGLVILAMYQLTFHFMVDQQQDFWQAMQSSRSLISRDYFGFTLFGIVLGLLNGLGMLFLGVGILVSLPVTWLAMTAAYLDFSGAAPTASPPPPPLGQPLRID